MARNPKEPSNKSETNEPSKSSPSGIFNTLFGNFPEDATTASLFSAENPFRRKPSDHQKELGLGFETSVENPNFGGSEVVNDSAELKTTKRKKNKRKDLEEGSILQEASEERIKKLKQDEKREDFVSKKSSKKEKVNKGISGSGLEEKLEKPDIERSNLGSDGKENRNAGNEGKGLGVEKKMKKRKRDEVEAEYEAKRYGSVLEEEKSEGGLGGGLVGEKRKKIDNPEDMMVSREGFDDEDKLLRTVFVGNLPLKIKKKALVKEFGKFGEVESVRIRSIPIVDNKIPRKGAIIRNKINEDGDSVHAYIVFKSEEFAQASLAHNMAVVGGNHIRVDRACPPRKKLKGESSPLYDNKRTVFVGNLPFDVKDEEMYLLFSSIKNIGSSVEAVRVIRDPNTSLGKGIAYVLFKTRDAASLVVKKHNLKLRDRELRISYAKPNSNSTPSKRKNSPDSSANNFHAKKFAMDSRSPGSYEKKIAKSAPLTYQGLQASKSGAQKKANLGTNRTQKLKVRMEKRPAVAARKAKSQKAAAAPKQTGMKRRPENRTPDSAIRNKKARKFK